MIFAITDSLMYWPVSSWLLIYTLHNVSTLYSFTVSTVWYQTPYSLMVENINCISCKLLPKLFATWLIFVSFDQVMIGGWHWWILMHFYYTFTPESRKLRCSIHCEVSVMNNLHLYDVRFLWVLVHSEVVSIMLY